MRTLLVPVGLFAVGALVAATILLDGPRALVLQLSPLVMLSTLTAVELFAGRWRPSWRNAGRDLFFFVLSAMVGAAAPALVLLFMPAAGGMLGGLPLLVAIPLAIVACDFVGYWVHRAFHTVPLLWRMHANHHATRELYVLVSTIDGPLMVFCIRALRAATAAALGFSADAVFALAVFDAWQGISSHVGVDTDNRWLARVLTTPQTHRVHHSSDPSHAGNYGLLLTLWDRVFGTWVAPAAEMPPLGLTAPSEFPASWWGILLLRKPVTPADGATRAAATPQPTTR